LLIFPTPVLIRHPWLLKTVVFQHWCLICAILLVEAVRSLLYLDQEPFLWNIFGVNFCILLINEIVKTCMNSKLFVELKNDKHFSCNSVFSETRLNTSLDTRFSTLLVTVSFSRERKFALSNTFQYWFIIF
jgi:hypothetical protein